MTAEPTYNRAVDGPRLGKQLTQVRNLMLRSWKWHTLAEIEIMLDRRHPQASISARLRELRRFGFLVERRRRRPGRGTWEYRVCRPE